MARTSASSTTYTVTITAVVASQPGTRYLASQPRRGWAQIVRTRARKAGATSSEMLRRPATMITVAAPPIRRTRVRGTAGEEGDAPAVIVGTSPSAPRRQSRSSSSRHGGRCGAESDATLKGQVHRGVLHRAARGRGTSVPEVSDETVVGDAWMVGHAPDSFRAVGPSTMRPVRRTAPGGRSRYEPRRGRRVTLVG